MDLGQQVEQRLVHGASHHPPAPEGRLGLPNRGEATVLAPRVSFRVWGWGRRRGGRGIGNLGLGRGAAAEPPGGGGFPAPGCRLSVSLAQRQRAPPYRLRLHRLGARRIDFFVFFFVFFNNLHLDSRGFRLFMDSGLRTSPR